ncbi:16S rRNA (guanine(966)-N(2))-methyltransferase RsmD [Virgibacillus phasianinus]|uniref:16S rRNA (Guanine(966)-N(2))-methyltransferase RsmD n=1 Tax=Virgibacillus phasianinus TaxID=2017483 RepID=A0A220U6J8_9BACI|nr:16S rRNA (guanine(966)-N(2))-methyltransferase RsmD [Virgibacillus phasianinus]ASK63602.1 16S rRNA (guanine(966)-N(2))-methyltransferase RsmD [Virgibacillus phasianinus]
MRVVAGNLKGRQVKAVPGNQTRPTTDKVKEAFFQIIGPFFEDGSCLDLFAGSGSLGIEAISRGMEHAIFVDKQSKAIQTIHENIKDLQLEERTEVFRTDAFRAMQAAAKRELKFNLVLLDPPYKKVDYGELLNELAKLDLVDQHGYIYCEHDQRENLPETHPTFTVIKQSSYGGTIGITLYQKTKKEGFV